MNIDCNFSELVSFLSKSNYMNWIYELIMALKLTLSVCVMKDGCNYARKDQSEKARQAQHHQDLVII
jgi:hypothetical protein